MAAPSGTSARPLVEGRDLAVAALLPGFAAASWVLPESRWEGLARALVGLRERIGFGTAAQARHIRAVTAGVPPVGDAAEIGRARLVNDYLERLQLLRVYRPGGWAAPMRVEGETGLHEALRAGRGAILWVANLSFHRQVTKMALHRAGYRVTHLSSINHGFSETHFGIRVLNPVRTIAEERFLEKRVVLETRGTKAAMTELSERLSGNCLVSITASATVPTAPRQPIFGGTIRLSAGPARLSARSGAPLLPVFTLRQPDGSFTVEIGEALATPTELGDEAAQIDATQRFAASLEERVRRFPDQFRWHEVAVAPPEAAGQ